MRPYYEDADGITIYHGDCREILPSLPKVDLVLTDPPYGVALAGKRTKWDRSLQNTGYVGWGRGNRVDDCSTYARAGARVALVPVAIRHTARPGEEQ